VILCVSVLCGMWMSRINRKHSSREYQLNCKRFTDKGKFVFKTIMTVISSAISAVLYFIDFSKFEFMDETAVKMTVVITNALIMVSGLMIVFLAMKLVDITVNSWKYDFSGGLTYRLADIKTSEEKTEN